MRPRSLLVAGLAAPLLVAAAGTASAGPRVGDFAAPLAPLNQPGSGEVHLAQLGTRLTVDLAATGLDDGLHVAHIHGVRQAENECPTLAADGNDDGRVDFLEGLPSYGPVQVTLSQPTDHGTALAYTRTFTHLDNGDGVASLGDLGRYAIVVHGVDLDGDGLVSRPDVDGDGPDPDDNEISMPALCGAINRD